jgi:hypothetical protein
MGFLTSLFGGFGGYAVAALLAAIFSGAGVGWIVHEIDQGSYQRLVASDAKAQVAAVETARDLQSKGDAVALAMALREAKAQQQIVTQTVTVTKEIPVYVTTKADAISCIPVSLERLLRAAAEGNSAGSLSLASGQSDDSCSDVSASEMAGWFTQYAGAARANAQQLNDLEATIKAWP